jgi:hypothetical protein
MPEEELRRDSDSLLQRLRRLGELELEKRNERMGSKRFRELAKEIAALSRDVMYRAIEEERDAYATEPSALTIDDVARAEDRARRS